MTHNAQNTTTTDIKQAIAQAVKIANFRYSVSGQPLFLDLAKSYGQTKEAYNLPRIAEQLTALQAQHNHLSELAEELNKTAKRATANPKERTEARKAEKALKAQITALNAQIDDLHNKLSATLPDLADLAQSAMIQQWLNSLQPADIPQTVLAVYGVDTADDLSDDDRAEAQQRANHRATKQAINRTIAGLASPQPITQDSKHRQPITAEEAHAFISTYGEGARVYIQSKGNRLTDRFDTVEYNQKAKQWERVSHYKAPVNYSYFTIYEDDEGNTTTSIDLIKSYNPFVNDLQEIIDLQTLLYKANCTANEFVFVEAYTDRTAGERARKARAEYYKTAPTPTREGADTAEHTARINYAWEKLGITNENTRRSFLYRLKNRLVKACNDIRAEKGLPPAQITANAVKRILHDHSEAEPTTPPTKWKPCRLADPAPIITWLNAQEAEQAREATADRLKVIYQEWEERTTEADRKAWAEYQRITAKRAEAQQRAEEAHRKAKAEQTAQREAHEQERRAEAERNRPNWQAWERTYIKWETLQANRRAEAERRAEAPSERKARINAEIAHIRSRHTQSEYSRLINRPAYKAYINKLYAKEGIKTTF